MTTDTMRAMMARRPFRPFLIHMADGRQVEVTHPEAVAYRGGRIAVVLRDDDRFEWVDLLLVSSLSDVDPASA